jgi:hypothetical protein
VFALTGTSGRIPASQLPKTGDNYAVIDLKAIGVRYVSAADSGVAGGLVQFAVNTYGERAHPAYPAEFDVYVDTNNDGNDDFVLYTVENGGFAATGQTVVAVVDLNTGVPVVNFFADADLNSGNLILTARASDLGITTGSKFRFSVYAFDNYFTGWLTDFVENMTFTAGTPRYNAGLGGAVPAGTSATLPVQAVPGGATASPSQSGFLLMYRDGAPGREAEAIPVQ